MQIRLKTLFICMLLLPAAISVVLPRVSGQTTGEPLAVDASSRYFTVVVSKDGFNGTANTLAINAVKGDRVHITFIYGDGELSYDNPHAIFIVGYDLRTTVISESNPTATLEFIATKTGTFAFYCVVPCVGMFNLESGEMVVVERPAGSLPTSIEVTVDEPAIQGQTVTIAATLSQGSQAIPLVHLDFYVNTSLGLVRLGSAITDQSGTARISYKYLSPGDFKVKVEFAGSESLAASSDERNLFVEPRSREPASVSLLPGISGESLSSLPYVRGQNKMPDLRFVGVPLSQGVPIITLVLLIVGSVWTTYGYVFAQLRAIMRGSREEAIEGKGGGEEKLESTSAKKGFDKRILLGVVLVVVVVAGFFAYYQFGSAPQPKTVTIEIDITEIEEGGEERHVFDPDRVTVNKGDHVILIVTNIDEHAIHGIVIPELNLNTGPLRGDEKATIEFDANTTGTFTILCSVPGCAPDHDQMIGELVVA